MYVLLKCPKQMALHASESCAQCTHRIQHSSIIHLPSQALILSLPIFIRRYCVETFNCAHLNWCMSFRYDLVNYRKFMISIFRLSTARLALFFNFSYVGLNLGVLLSHYIIRANKLLKLAQVCEFPLVQIQILILLHCFAYITTNKLPPFIQNKQAWIRAKAARNMPIRKLVRRLWVCSAALLIAT